jgi:small subunit ribosomal protein S8
MGMTDPVADMLTRIRNGSGANFKVDIPSSKLKVDCAYSERRWLRKNLSHEGQPPEFCIYHNTMIKIRKSSSGFRVSRPSRRVYAERRNSQVLNGLGISILSTSKDC